MGNIYLNLDSGLDIGGTLGIGGDTLAIGDFSIQNSSTTALTVGDGTANTLVVDTSTRRVVVDSYVEVNNEGEEEAEVLFLGIIGTPISTVGGTYGHHTLFGGASENTNENSLISIYGTAERSINGGETPFNAGIQGHYKNIGVTTNAKQNVPVAGVRGLAQSIDSQVATTTDTNSGGLDIINFNTAHPFKIGDIVTYSVTEQGMTADTDMVVCGTVPDDLSPLQIKLSSDRTSPYCGGSGATRAEQCYSCNGTEVNITTGTPSGVFKTYALKKLSEDATGDGGNEYMVGVSGRVENSETGNIRYGAALYSENCIDNGSGNYNIDNCVGLFIKKQTNGTNNYGLIIRGDGLGSDIVLGVDQDIKIYGTSSNNKLTTTAEIFRLEPISTAPATCAIGDFYIDTSGAACACSATDTWSNMHSTGMCS